MKPLFVLMILIFSFQNLNATTYYVDLNQPTSGSGTISSPFNNLSDALLVATTNGDEILITEGTINFGSTITINNLNLIIKGGYNSTFNAQIGYTTLDGENTYRVLSTQSLTSVTLFDHLVISNGYTTENGGGMYNDASSPTLTNIIFINNYANSGGGIFNDSDSNPVFTNAIISYNIAATYAGGMYNNQNTEITVVNATITNNSASSAAGIYNYNSDFTIKNTVLFNNISTGYSSSISNLTGDINGLSSNNASNGLGGNISNSTNFIALTETPFINDNDPDGADNTFGTADDGLILGLGSPLLDVGNNSFISEVIDIAGQPRIYDTTIDIGAYEVQSNPCSSSIVYVSTTATGNNDGSDWDNAFTDLQTAIYNACIGAEIRIAAQTFNVTTTIHVTSDRIIKGGYDTATNTQTGYTILDGGNPSGGTTGVQVLSTSNLTTASELNHLVIQNGYSVEGGGMYNYFSNALLTNIFIYNNTAGEICGGIFNNYSNPTLTNVTICNNTATYHAGGMLNFTSSPTLINVTFSHNTSLFASGGGMNNSGLSTPILHNTVFYGNTASYGNDAAGDAVDASSSNIASDASFLSGIFSNSDYYTYVELFEDPFFNSSDPDGEDNIFGTSDDGLIPAIRKQILDVGNNSYNAQTYDPTGRERVFNGTIDIGAYEYSYVCLNDTIYVDNALATGNNDGSNWDNAFTDLQTAIDLACEGAEIRIATQTINLTETIYVEDKNVLIKGGYDTNTNTQTSYTTLDGGNPSGGTTGVQILSTKDLTPDALFDHLIIQNGYSNSGGGMYNHSTLYPIDFSSSPTLNYVTFSNNSASYGGGMYSYGNNDNPTLNHVTFDNNSADIGGGLYSSNVTLTDITFTNNTAFNGGGLYLYSSNATLTNVTFTNNTAVSYGGGMYLSYGSSSTLTNVTISNNTAGEGGGIYNDNSSPVLNQTIISNNTATNNGGGMCNYNNSSPTLNQVTISSNTATNNGGGVYNTGKSDPTLTNVSISNNTATNNGGGVYNNDNSNPILTNVIISNNMAYNGGGLCNDGDNSSLNVLITLTNVTIFNNTATNEGGGVYSNYFPAPILYNTVFYSNVRSSDNSISDYEGDYNIYDSSSNNASDGTGGGISTTNASTFVALTSDPFVNSSDPYGEDDIFGTTDDGLVPAIGSLLINAGDQTENSSSLDISGLARVLGGEIEIGAYEFDDSTLSVEPITLTENSLIVYPNPTESLVYVVTDETLEAVIYNQIGKKISNKTISSTNNFISLSKFPSGVYMIKFMKKGEVISIKKVVKQ